MDAYYLLIIYCHARQSFHHRRRSATPCAATLPTGAGGRTGRPNASAASSAMAAPIASELVAAGLGALRQCSALAAPLGAFRGERWKTKSCTHARTCAFARAPARPTRSLRCQHIGTG